MAGFVKSSISYISGTALSQMILFISMPILSRIYSIDDFGHYSFFLSLLSIIGVVSCLRIEVSIPQLLGDQALKNVKIFSLCLNSAFALLVFFISVNVFYFINDDFVILLLSFAVFLFGCVRVNNFLLIRKGFFNKLSISKIIQNLCCVVFQFFFFFLFDSAGLIYGYLLGMSVSLLYGYSVIDRWPFFYYFKRLVKYKVASLIVRKYKRFLIYDSFSAFLNTLSTEIPNILFLYYLGPSAAGGYLMAQRIIGAPITLVSQSISQVFYPTLKTKISNNQHVSFFFKVLFFQFLLGAVPFFIFVNYSERLFSLFLGNDWGTAGVLAGYLVYSLFAQFVFVSISYTFIVLNKQKTNMIIQFLLLLYRFFSIVIFSTVYKLSMNDLIFYFSLGSALIYITGIALSCYFILREKRYEI
ncbi:oligosaccharide flippase family protein [Pectobacterium versatile]|uniref:oligosaccharide flippase family protein n=1 Tax=Pectobacterium versatile TaxID=2488639 RepID=UPI0030169A4A